MRAPPPSDIVRSMLLIITTAALLAASLWTLLPFLGSLLWATTIVVATWPLLLALQRQVGGRRGVATLLMIVSILAVVVLPFTAAITTLLEAAEHTPAVVREFLAQGLDPPPPWVEKIPGIGAPLADRWQELSSAGPQALAESVRPYVRSATAWALAASSGFAMMILHIALTIVLAAILYLWGDQAARSVLAVAHRIGRERGEHSVQLAGQAIRSVALGVIVTALVQAILAGLGLWVSGIPRPGVLTAVVLLLGIIQLGPLLVLAPAVAWLYWTGSAGWASALLVWSLPVIALDNVLRPLLIRRGVALPLWLILAGVIGGLLGFGVAGLFIGPVSLAVTYTLMQAWVAEDRADLRKSGTPLKSA